MIRDGIRAIVGKARREARYTRQFGALSSANRMLRTVEAKYHRPRLRSMPFSCEIELTNRCNLDCAQCYRHGHELALGRMSIDTFSTVFDQVKRWVTAIDVTGFGEPLTYPQLESVIEVIKRHNRHIATSFYTNGTLLTEKSAAMLVRAGHDSVFVSLDATTAATYAKVRGGSFERVTGNIERLVRLRNDAGRTKPAVVLDYCVMPENLDETSQLVELAARLGVDRINPLRIVNLVWGYAVEDHEGWLARCQQGLDALEAARPELERRWGYELVIPQVGQRARVCPWPWNTYVSWDGWVKLCCWVPMPEDYNLGNVLETPLMEILSSERYVQLREHFARGQRLPICKDCNM